MKTNLWIGLLTMSLACALSVRAQTDAADGKKIIGAKVRIKAEKVEEFVAVAKTLIAASRAEPGNISYTLLQDPYDRTSFFFFEEWKSQAAIDAHFATPHFKDFGAQLKELVASPPEIVIYDAPAQKKVE